jgi:hypothetical protein
MSAAAAAVTKGRLSVRLAGARVQIRVLRISYSFYASRIAERGTRMPRKRKRAERKPQTVGESSNEDLRPPKGGRK